MPQPAGNYSNALSAYSLGKKHEFSHVVVFYLTLRPDPKGSIKLSEGSRTSHLQQLLQECATLAIEHVLDLRGQLGQRNILSQGKHVLGNQLERHSAHPAPSATLCAQTNPALSEFSPWRA